MLSLHIYNSPSKDETKFKNLLYDKPIDELHNQVVNMEIPSYVEGILSSMTNDGVFPFSMAEHRRNAIWRWLRSLSATE